MNERDYSPTYGGLFNELCIRLRLSDASFGFLGRRVFAVILLTWFPLAVLSLINGALVSGVRVPFLCDFAAHARFLIAGPLLLFAEAVAHRKVTPIIREFVGTGVIRAEDRPQFDSIVEHTAQLRRSKLIEGALILFVIIAGGDLGAHRWIEFKFSTWAITQSQSRNLITPAGYWFAYISLPLIQYLLTRWYFRVLLWTLFLWRVSRLKLNLLPTHSDGCGGLGFLNEGFLVFAPFLTAHGSLAAGVIANRIFYDGADLVSFKGTLAMLACFLLIITFGPLFVFVDKLLQVRSEGRIRYGAFATRYMSEFDQKWLKSPAASDPALLGSSDIQSLADMTNSFAVVLKMRIVPFEKEKVITAAGLILGPVAPLLLTVFPAEELLKRLLSMMLG